MTNEWPRVFRLERDVDVSGVSGTGIVAWGVIWPDGTVCTRWCGERPSTVAWSSYEDLQHVHGHGGATRFVYDLGAALLGAAAAALNVERDQLRDTIARVRMWADQLDDTDREGLLGILDAPPICTCTYSERCANCRASDKPTREGE